jgi:hypothetical protein
MTEDAEVQRYLDVIQVLLSDGKKADIACVYILGCGNHIKVGISNNVEARILELQIGNPVPIKKLWETVGMSRIEATRLERKVHGDLADARITGEWFECSANRAMSAILRLSETRG